MPTTMPMLSANQSTKLKVLNGTKYWWTSSLNPYKLPIKKENLKFVKSESKIPSGIYSTTCKENFVGSNLIISRNPNGIEER
jgi:hypothetical protein